MSAPNPKDSMKSTWRSTPKDSWTVWHWLFEVMGIHPTTLDKAVPIHSKEEPIPYLPEWKEHRWVLSHGVIPLVLHQTYVAYTGQNLGGVAAFVLYTVAFKAIAINQLHMLRGLGHKYGFFDGDKHARDDVPDVGVAKVAHSLMSTSTFRPMFTVMLAYNSAATPLAELRANWAWAIVEVSLYGIILDFWFYWYHRLMHDVDALWKYHRTHHLTKHPNPLLTLYADVEQEFWDIAGVPLLTYGSMKLMGMPMGFYEWWLCHQYIVFSELAGHSGLRIYARTASPLTWLMKLLGAELVIEDHDLHHRTGWKKSHNYGKQTRLWDRIFGTCRERIESREEMVDYGTVVDMPWF